MSPQALFGVSVLLSFVARDLVDRYSRSARGVIGSFN